MAPITMQQMKSRYQVVESTDLRTGVKSYRVYLRNSVGPSVTGDFKTRAEAEAKLIELELELEVEVG